MLSFVIPVYNESESLEALYRELLQVAETHEYPFELIFVDDGSTDGSWGTIRQLVAQDSRVRAIRFRRNFGKAAALDAGFGAARGEFVFTLDGDLQDDPQEIPRFLDEMQHFDVVSGWKQVRHDPWHKVYPSRVFNWLVGRLTQVHLHDHNCGFKCYRREVLDELRLYGELHRFVPVLAAARGWRVGEITVNHRARKFGKSKYGLVRIVKGFLDLFTVYFVTTFSHRPQHLFGSVGLLCFLTGLAVSGGLATWWCISRLSPEIPDLILHRRALFYYSIMAVLLGAQLVTIGFLAELITAYFGREMHAYSISEKLGASENPSTSGTSALPDNETRA